MQPANPRTPGDRPFPWPCSKCRQREVVPQTIPYTAEINHDGTMHSVHVPTLEIPKCCKCGQLLFDNRADEQITAALRKQLRLLSPELIRGNRKKLALTQRELAERLGVAEETISRWETGALIQSRAMDNLLRIYFANAEVRAVLVDGEQDPSLGTTVNGGAVGRVAHCSEDQLANGGPKMSPGETPHAATQRAINVLKEAILAYVQQHPGAYGADIDAENDLRCQGNIPYGKTLRMELVDEGRLRFEMEGRRRRWYLPKT